MRRKFNRMRVVLYLALLLFAALFLIPFYLVLVTSFKDVAELRQCLVRMRAAADALDGIEFIHANWALHARIAAVSPSVMLRSFYLSLLEMIESHTLSVQSVDDNPLPYYLDDRYQLHAELVSAIERQDAQRALDLIGVHNATTVTADPAPPGGHGTRA